MRRSGIHRLVAVLCILLAACCALAAAPLSFAADAPSAEKRIVRVGFFEFDGYHMVDSEGERSGYGYELICYLARYNNWDVEYIGYDKSWSEMQDMLASGEIDILTSAQKTPSRIGRFDFSDEDVGTSLTMLTVKSGDLRYESGDYSTYNGMRVGMLRGSSRNDDFAGFAAERGFSYLPVYYDTNGELASALQSGLVIDAALTSSLRSTQNEWILDEFNASPFYVMVRKGDSGLLAQVNEAITTMDLDMPGWRTDLSNKYYTADSGEQLALDADERAYIDSANESGVVFKVAVNPDCLPYSCLDESGAAVGVFPTVFDEIARRAGISYEVIPTKTRADYEAAVESGEADIVMDSTFTLNAAEKRGYILDDSYAQVTISRLNMKSAGTAFGTICMPDDVYTVIQSLGRTESGQQTKFEVKDTVQECVDAVLNGSCDAAYLYTYTAAHYMNDDESNRMTVLLMPEYTTGVSLAVNSRLDTQLVSTLDKASHSVEQFASETMVSEASASSTRKTTLVTLFYDYPFAAVGMIFGLGLVLLFTVILVARSRAAKVEREKRLQLEESEVALSKALAEAQRANEAKSTFLSSMSHDMRTPLNGILGFTDLALGTDDEAARKAYLDKIQLSGGLMLGLVNDTLDLSKIESGKMVFDLQPVSAVDVTAAIVNTIKVAADEKHVDFEYDTDDEKFGVVRVDRVRLQQVFLNLLSNAVKFTPEGGTVRYHVEYLGEPQEGCNCRATVSDNGIGIGSDFLPHLFEPFSQERAKESGGVSGTGLGLSIVKSIVDMMGGSIAVESKKGEGTTFTVMLPIEIVHGEEAASAIEPAAQADLRGKRVLLVEDNNLNAEIAVTQLASRGAGVVRASDGKEGLAAFEASAPGTFDVVLMDLRMPEMDGYAAARAIRALAREDAQSVPILAMSADAYSDDVKRCFEAGMNGHVSKPVEPTRLFSEIARVCAIEHGSQDAS